MRLIKALALLVTLVMLGGCANQSKQVAMNEVKPDYLNFTKPREAAYFVDYVAALKSYAQQQGIDSQTINIAFRDVYYVQHVIQADKNQPEKKVTLADYLARAVSPARIALAKQKYAQYYSQIHQATLLTQVPESYILALWGVESGYGKYQGNDDIISALATLAFDGRREQFFVKELLAALTILQNGHIQKAQFKGSWAGAMGQNQFMPSSYLTYGLDGDGDGVIDIWNNMADIFASTANYLATVGWNNQEGWGNKIKLPANFNTQLAGLDTDQSQSVKQWLQLGITLIDDTTRLPQSSTAWVIIPDAQSGEGYLVSNNFRTLMHWNRSYYFAVSVGMLADSLTGGSTDSKRGK